MRLRGIFIALVATSTTFSSASVVFNNFGAGDAYDTNFWLGLPGTQKLAKKVTSTTNQNLTLVKLALVTGADYEVTFTSASSGAPGSTLSSWNVLGGGVVSLSPVSTVNLVIADYFVVVRSINATTGAWYLNNTGNNTYMQFDARNGWTNQTGTSPVLRVEANAVPEPATLSVCALGAAAVIRRRRKN